VLAIGNDERRARLVRRHLLSPAVRASTVSEVADAVVALHSTDPVTVFLSILARSTGLTPDAIERELYDARTIVRMLGMRRTLFVVPRALRPIVQAACTDEIAARERARLEGWLAAAPGIEDPARFVDEAQEQAVAVVAARGELATAEVARVAPALATKVRLGSGRWAIEQSVAARVLPLAAAHGRLLRARPRGSWISSQYRWADPEAWLGERQPAAGRDEARAELIRRWLGAFGPGTELDLRWWEVELEGGRGFVLPDDEEREPLPPSAALLPALDPTPMGWKERRWFLGDHERTLFDSNGNIGPTVWWHGRIVGGWAQRPDGKIAVRLLEDVGEEASAAVDVEAARLVEWLGDVRVTTRFATPLERELVAR
jgi:DNA glycosylase AlkZ-like